MRTTRIGGSQMKSHYRNHCLAVAVLSTALPTAAWGDISGYLTLAVDTSLNLDTGVTASNGGDIFFTGTSILLGGSASAVNFSEPGYVEFDALTLAGLSMITPINYSQSPIGGTSLTTGDVFGVYTNGGHYAKVLIGGVGSQQLSLQYTTYGASVPGGPAIAQVQNNYSFIPPGLPNYGIAPGSLFTVSGTNLSSSAPPVLQSSAAPGLPQSLNGTSVSVTVNGVTTVPALYYTSATQVAAVLPSTTPAGTGTITLTYNGQTSAAAPIQVVSSALGLDSVYGNGSGQGVVTDASGNLFGFTSPAQPGQTVVLWGSGVGPDTSNDDRTFPQNQNNLTDIPMQVYIGGISANVLYRGRSQYPGVDQIDVVIPLNVLPGCFVSVVAVSGPIVSNTATVPIGGPLSCSDAGLNYSGKQFQSLATGKANIQVGTILAAEGILSSGTAAWNAGATFQVVQSGLYGSGYGDASEGSCVVMSPAASTEGPFQSYGLDAGTIAITWPGGLSIMNETPGDPGIYLGHLTAGPSDSPQGIQYSFVGTGGRDVAAFSSGVTLESPPLIWINLGSVTAITRSQGVTVTWVDQTSGPLNDIEIRGGLETTTAGGTTVPVAFVCHAPVTAGSFTIPPSILMALPAGTGTLSVAHLFSALYPANGPFDLFQATGRVVVSQNVTYK
ncbi:MAG TPA: hypothetical protein VGG72_13880 [Bryobacteraceae bacterium]